MMRKLKYVLLFFMITLALAVTMTAMNRNRREKHTIPDEYAAYRVRREHLECFVPVFSEVPLLSSLFSTSEVSEQFAWSDWNDGAAIASPDGRYMVIGTRWGQIGLWDMESPENSRSDFAELGPLSYTMSHDNPVIPELCWMAMTQDGSQLAVAYSEKLFLLDVASAKIKQTIDIPSQTVNWGNTQFSGDMPFALSPCGKFFTCDAREDGISCVKVIGTETGEEIFTKKLSAVTWHNLVSRPFGDGPNGPMWETKCESVAEQDTLIPPCFSPDGKQLLIALQNHGAEILDAMTGETVAELKFNDVIEPNETWSTSRTAFSPDGKFLVTTGHVREKSSSTSLAFNPSSAPANGKILLWDAKTCQLLQNWDLGDEKVEIVSVAFSPDNNEVLVGHSTVRSHAKHETMIALTVTQYDVESGKLTRSTEISQCGGAPLVPEFRPLCNSQSRKFCNLPQTIGVDFTVSFRSK